MWGDRSVTLKAGDMTPASQVEVHVDGQSSGAAFLATSTTGAELCILGKLSLVLLGEGQAAIVARPEPPGVHAGGAAPAELEEASGGMLVVGGGRAFGGRVVLRRGATMLAEIAFGPGHEPAAIVMSGSSETGDEPTSAEASPDEEWLVVEGVTSPDARRWCKLPRMKLVATWEPASSLLLGSRACFLDVSTWTVSFILRGRLPLAAPAPRSVMVSVEDTFVSSVRARPQPEDEDDEVRTAVRDAPPPVTRPIPTSPLDEQTRLIQIPLEIPPEALPDSARRRAASRRSDRPARSGLRLGTLERPATDPSGPEPAPLAPEGPGLVLDEETTRVGQLPQGSPSSVTRAFAAASGDATDMRGELLRRVRDGERLDSLELRGAGLAGIVIPGATLSGLDLTGCDLRGANLAGVDLRSSRLDRALLDGCTLDGAHLGGASLVNASLRGVTLTGASFEGADLTSARIGADCPDEVFFGATVDGIIRD